MSKTNTVEKAYTGEPKYVDERNLLHRKKHVLVKWHTLT
jgi:hypothetical protein